MSAVGRKTRTQRARPILVQAGLPNELVSNLAKDLQPTGARVVGTLFDAVCDAGQARASTPVSAVLMGPPPHSMAERDIVEAFRRTDPSVRLVRLFSASEADRVESMMNAGFDDAISIPVATHRLIEAVGGIPPTPETSEDVTVPTPESLPASQSTASTPMPSIVEVVLEDAWARFNQEDRPAQTGGTPAQPSVTPNPVSMDTSLVRSVLAGEDIEEKAIQLIQQHTGLTGVQFTLLNPDEPTESKTDDAESITGTQLQVPAAEGLCGVLSSPDPNHKQLLEPWVDWLSNWLLMQHQYTQFRHMALFDHLTGAGNRHALFLVLDRVIERARRERRHLTVMYFDIDNFKTYNDQFGHAAGDQVLCETVHLLNSVIRRGDHVFRMGGDEFVVVFADPSGPRSAHSTPPESIEQIVQRFQQQVGTLQLPQIGLDAPGTLSISAGMVAYPWDGRTAEELLQRADQLALESKRSGKNGIIYGPAARNLHRR